MRFYRFLNKKVLKNGGFTLVEIVIAMALLGGVGLIAAKLMEMIDTNSKASTKKESQLKMQLMGLKLVEGRLKGLKRNQFRPELFYQLMPNSSFISNFPGQINASTLTNLITDPLPSGSGPGPYLTSFLFRKKLGERYLTYISACIPLANMVNLTGITYATLQKNPLWPFIRSNNTTNGFNVYCCPRSNPMCTSNPVLTKNSNYGVLIFRYDPVTNALKSILHERDFESLSSMGYFIFSNASNDKLLQGRVFTFYNECLSQRILTGQAKPNCNDFLNLRSGMVNEEFDYAEEGINNMGSSIGL